MTISARRTYKYLCPDCGSSSERTRLIKNRNKLDKCPCGAARMLQISIPYISASEPRLPAPSAQHGGFGTAIRLESGAIGTQLNRIKISGADIGVDVEPGASADLDDVEFHRTRTGIRTRGTEVTGRNVSYY